MIRLLSFFKTHALKSTLLLVFIAGLWLNLNQGKWQNNAVFAFDVGQYYSYLPATFYEKDLSLNFLHQANYPLRGYYAPQYTPSGAAVIKMSMGVAITQLPFFGLAHVFASTFNYPVDGFSEPYRVALIFSSLFYYLLGLLFLFKVLSHFFDTSLSASVLLLITFGSNVLYYLGINPGMSHPLSFFLLSAFLFFSLQFQKKQTALFTILLGICLGLLILVRPINALFVLIPLLYGLDSKNILLHVRAQLHLWPKYLVIALFAFLVCLPQLLYWKAVTGHYIFNSYVGEHFYFAHPHIIEGLFGFRKGWFVYTPAMVFAVIGLLQVRKYAQSLFIVSLLLLIIYTYVVFSWWCWWYGGSFGMRAMIDLYPLLALPLAAFLKAQLSKSSWQKKLTITFCVFFVVLNLFQTMQAKYNILHYDSMTARAYFKIFGATSHVDAADVYLEKPNYKKALAGDDE